MSNQIINSGNALSNNALSNITNIGNSLVNQSFYQKILTRANPTAFVLLIDQSGSMNEGEFDINGKLHTKAEALAHYVNIFLDELVNKSTRDDGLRNYMDVCIIGYGADNSANPAWIGNLKDKTWVTIKDLSEHCTKSETTIESVGRGGVIQKKTIINKSWIEPLAKYKTPMGNALSKTYTLLDEWIRTENHKESFPPTVINFTDGMATDATNAELIELANKIKNLHTQDGNVLLYNCHLSIESNNSVLFPINKQELPSDEYAHTLLEMSSIIPQQFNSVISNTRNDNDILSKYYGMMYNSGVSAIASLLKLGTTLANTQAQ